MYMGQGIYAGQHKGTADRVVRGEKHRALSGGLSGMDGRYGILKPTKV